MLSQLQIGRLTRLVTINLNLSLDICSNVSLILFKILNSKDYYIKNDAYETVILISLSIWLADKTCDSSTKLRDIYINTCTACELVLDLDKRVHTIEEYIIAKKSITEQVFKRNLLGDDNLKHV